MSSDNGSAFSERLHDALVAAAKRRNRQAHLLEAFDDAVALQDHHRIGHIHFHCTDVDDWTTYAVASTWPDPLWRL